MKAIISILLLLSIHAKAFNEFELNSKLLRAINEYRISNGLDTLEYDSICNNAAIHHSNYLSKLGILTHDELLDVDSFNEIDTLENRFIGLTESYIVGENIMLISDTASRSLDNIVKVTMNGWKNSKEHNDLLLDPGMNKAAINFSTSSFLAYFEEYAGDYVYQTYEVPYVYWIVF